MIFKRKTSNGKIRQIGFKVPRKPPKKLVKRVASICAVLILIPHIYALILKFVPVPGTILMTQRANVGEIIKQDWVDIDNISPNLIYAVIGAEDSRFCDHSGVDWEAVQTVLDEREKGERQRGGSTITQQTAKNVFLWNSHRLLVFMGDYQWMNLFLRL
mgnify:CR=1 FL=1